MRQSICPFDRFAADRSPLTGRSLGMTDDGIVMGDGSILVRMMKGAGGTTGLALEADRDRFQALMSVVGGRSVPIDVYRHVEAADHHWRRGEKALANLRLILADLPCVDTRAEAARLTLAEHLLDGGMPAADLMKELGLSGPSGELAKYRRDQPRVAAGHGRESGRFGSGGGQGGLLARLKAFAALIVRLGTGPAAFVTFMVIPTPNSGGVVEDDVPDMPGVRFKKDGPAGTLKLATNAPDGGEVVVHAEARRGVYINLRTGEELGRDFGMSIALDTPSIRAALDTEIALKETKGPERGPETKTDEPQLCPASEREKAHGDRGLEYENDVHARVNPDDPTPSGHGYRVWDPGDRAFYVVDDCFKKHGDLVDGDMKAGDLVEAKGPEYEELFKTGIGDRVMNKLLEQARRQKRAADFRGVRLKFYFAQKGAADLVRQRFAGEPLLRDVVVTHMPARKAR